MSICIRPMSVKEALIKGRAALRESKIGSYMLDATLLLTNVTGFTKTQLYTNECHILDALQIELYFSLIARRCGNEPVKYILNRCEFMGHDFYVDANVLIPRPETEMLVEQVLSYVNLNHLASEKLVIVDIGTGSGAIAVELAARLINYDLTVLACDISLPALNVAQRNASSNRVEDKILFIQSDLFNNIPPDYKNNVNIVVSNPPYIERDTISSLDIGVKCFEPHTALDGGSDGLYFYRAISANARQYLTQSGAILYEIGYNQAKSVGNILSENGYENISIYNDYSGLDRIVTAIVGGSK